LTSLVASTNYSINYTGLSSGNCSAQPLMLTTGQSCTFNVAFTPTSLGVITGTVTANFTGDPNSVTQLVMNVTGTGTEVKITGSLAFGTTTSPLTKSVTITNEGTTTLTFSPAPTLSGTGASAYAIDPYSGSVSTCLNPSAMLTHGQTCTIAVTFTPPGNNGMSFPATLNINDNGGNSPQTVAITGKD